MKYIDAKKAKLLVGNFIPVTSLGEGYEGLDAVLQNIIDGKTYTRIY